MQNSTKKLWLCRYKVNQHKWERILINGFIRKIRFQKHIPTSIIHLIHLYFMIFLECFNHHDEELFIKFVRKQFNFIMENIPVLFEFGISFEAFLQRLDKDLRYYSQIAFGRMKISINDLKKYQIGQIAYEFTIKKIEEEEEEEEEVEEDEQDDLSGHIGFVESVNAFYIGYNFQNLQDKDTIKLAIQYTTNVQKVTFFVNEDEKESKRFYFKESWRLMIRMSPRSKLRLKKFVTTRY